MARILVAGATGQLGSRIVQMLLQQGRVVRAMTRTGTPKNVEIAIGDLTDPASLKAACEGVTHVISTANAVMGKGDASLRVDVEGTRNLAEAARAAGVPYTIVRPTAFLEVWKQIIVSKPGAATIFGDGNYPINFISIDDVARTTVALLFDPKAENKIVDLAGHDELTLNQLVDMCERETGHKIKRKHIPLVMMRIMKRVVKPFNPVMSRLMSMGYELVTTTPVIRPGLSAETI